jgi:NAD(P)H-nitrite reductase large subunit
MKIVIIGNGVAGTTCAMETRKRHAEAEITIVGKESPYFFSRTALMYVLMGKMSKKDLEPFERSVYKHQNIRLMQDTLTNIVSLPTAESKGSITTNKNGALEFDKLVLALGAKPNMFSWKGLSNFEKDNPCKTGIVNFVSLQDMDACEFLFSSTQRAIVVGGGLIGIELVECLLNRGIPVTFLVREPHFWPMALNEEEASIVKKHMISHGVELKLNEEIAEILQDNGGRVRGILTNKGHTIECNFLGICVGVSPNVEPLKSFSLVPNISRGVLVNRAFETSLPGVYGCGDCAEISDEKIVETIWYSAKRHGKLVAQSLSGDRVSYTPPTFFNSSKFFDIEFTTVGEVENAPKNAKNFTKILPEKNASVRFVTYENCLIGLNLLGGRVDHEVVVQWVEERRSLEYCLKNFKQAQFDVEFGRIKFENA